MKRFKDREYNRLMNNADDLLSNITVYEAPSEERTQKPGEEAAKGKAEALAQEERPVEQEQTGTEVLVQEEKPVEMEAVERELAEAEALVQEIQRKEAGLLKQEQEAQTAADDLEMDWQQEQEYAARESISALVKKEDSLFGCSLFSVVCFMYMEVILHLSIYHSIDTTIVYPLLFAAGIGCMAAVVSSFLSKGWNTVLFCFLLIFCSFYYDLQIVYHAASGAFLSLTDIPAGISMLLRQGEAVLPGMTVALPWLVLMFLPVLLWAAAGRKWIRFEQSRWWSRLLVAAAGILTVVIGILCLDLHGYEPDSPYVCFYHFDSETQMEETGRQLGIPAMTGLELLEQISR